MESIAKTFHKIFGELGIGKAVKVEILRGKWEEIFGETIGRCTSPLSYQNGELVINVNSPEWLHELQYHNETILAKLRPFDVTRVRFRIGRISRRAVKTVPKQKTNKLTSQDCDFINVVTSDINDASLKERLKRAIETSITNAKNSPKT